MTLQAGTTLAGYTIERLLGRGGMGEVYLATHVGLGRKVALKILAPALAADPRFRQRFIAESRLASALDHPNIVPIYEAGEADERLFIAMRFVEGSDLGALIERHGPLQPARAIELLVGVARALDAAHGRGLIHRDVKPGNILIARTGMEDEHAYLGDFGLTKQMGSGVEFTKTGQLVGSLDYVAPEQIEGRPIDGRVDVYSLACVLYAAVAGQPPYPRQTEVATLWAHVQADPPRASDVFPSLVQFDPVIAQGMAKDPAARYGTCGELMAAAAGAAAAGHSSVAAATTTRQPAPAAEGRRARTRRIAGIVGLAAGVGALALAGFVAATAFDRSPGDGSTSSPSAPAAAASGSAGSPPGGSSASPGAPAGGAPTTSAPPGRLAYVFFDSTFDSYIVQVRSDGSGQVQLTDRGAFAYSPSWSPDGSTIAYERNTPVDGPVVPNQVWFIEPDGTHNRQVTRETSAHQPAWSPDGTQLAIVLTASDPDEPDLGTTRSAIGILDAASGEVSVIGEDEAYFDSEPTWSPDGSRIAFQRESRPAPGELFRQEIWTMKVDGTDVRPLIARDDAAVTQPAWSPDGTSLAFTLWPTSQDADIYLADPDGTGLRRLTEHPAQDDYPAWSRDGRFLAFTSNRDFQQEVYVMASDGSGARRLTQSPEGGGATGAAWGPEDTIEP